MRIEGNGQLHLHSPDDEGPHAAGAHEWWNESVWLHFMDDDSGTYGIFRIGHQPNVQGGIAVYWTLLGVPGRIFRFSGLSSMSERDRSRNGLSANGSHFFTFDERACWKVKTDDFMVDLSVEDDHPPLDYFSGNALAIVAKNHIVAAGRVNGSIRVGSRLYSVSNAPAVRDHSWGPRIWSTFRSHRWAGMSFGRDRSATALTWCSDQGELTRFGFVRRGDVIHAVSKLDILAYMEPDGVTNRGGAIDMVLHNGEQLRIDCSPISKGLVSTHHGQVIVDTPCRATLDGRAGVVCFETTNNSSGGSIYPTQKMLVRGLVDNGEWPV